MRNTGYKESKTSKNKELESVHNKCKKNDKWKKPFEMLIWRNVNLANYLAPLGHGKRTSMLRRRFSSTF